LRAGDLRLENGGERGRREGDRGADCDGRRERAERRLADLGRETVEREKAGEI